MLTLEILFAVLQGLPPVYITHLEPQWHIFCQRIHRALNLGHDPLGALQAALGEATFGELELLSKMMGELEAVRRLEDLTYRQKELLTALRYVEVASLTQLKTTVAQDRGNTHRRLQALCAKGYAFKFYRKEGIFYYATPSSMAENIKQAVPQHIREFLAALNAGKRLEQKPTRTTTPTTSTTSTTPTNPTTTPLTRSHHRPDAAIHPRPGESAQNGLSRPPEQLTQLFRAQRLVAVGEEGTEDALHQ
jgi:hypothetical protein